MAEEEKSKEKTDWRAPRVWTSKDGKELKASLVDFQSNRVVLKKEGGKTLRIPLKRFSESDQEFVDKFVTEKNASKMVPLPKKPLRILFIGNSYTRPLPDIFLKLVRSAGMEATIGKVNPNGMTLARHASTPNTIDKIKDEKWDYVVLQEQSQIPALEPKRSQMKSGAKNLHQEIRKSGAKTVLFMTWGRKNGDSQNRPSDTFHEMQSRLKEGYMEVAKDTGAIVAPAGMAWQEARKRNPKMDLFLTDGSHPNHKGSYLNACVFYATLYKRSPEDISFLGGVPKAEAKLLQNVAAQIVIKNFRLWNIR